MSVTITTWHNTHHDRHGNPTALILGFAPEHQLVPVDRFTLSEDPRPQEYPAMCDFVFWLFNVGEDTDPHARAYRERGNRSLSVGDVVQIEQHWFAVAAIGFTAIAAPLRLDGPARPLSTRIDLTAPDPVTGPGTDTPAPSGQEAHR